MNRTKSLLLLAALTALFLIIGQAIGGQVGLILALLLAGGMNFFSYWYSDKIVLRMYNAQEVTEADAPQLYGMVRELAQRGGIPMPRVYLIPEETPNAFATGRNPQHAAVAVTEGLMQMLNPRELAGVIAHELGHVMNRDTLIMTIAASLAGALSYLASFAMFFGGGNSDDEEEGGSNIVAAIVGMVVAMIAAPIIQMAISRSREFVADETGARLTNDPLALAGALRKIEAWSQEIPIHSGSPATAHMFIINPFSGGGISRLFSTHPSTEQRIERLEALASEKFVLT
ncbi:MAG TPA: zinc metalloprotease HtpX [Blastocatellia bacterium]|nr:zinc metalloprotease HtpX [Blastocatellia bacterium]